MVQQNIPEKGAQGKLKLHKDINAKLSLSILAGVVIIIGVVLLFLNHLVANLSNFIMPFTNPPVALMGDIDGFEVFMSAEDFKTYLEENQATNYYGWGGGVIRDFALEMAPQAMDEVAMKTESQDGLGAGSAVERISETNVQVQGIDEPDIVKTDGEYIYFSPGYNYYWRGVGGGVMAEDAKMIAPPYYQGLTNIIKALPADDLALQSKIEKSGNLLLKDNILAIFESQVIYGYDISDREAPKEAWKIKLEQNSYLQQARLQGDKLYLLVSDYIAYDIPCPLRPLTSGEETIEIACNTIYHPSVGMPVDVVYTAFEIDIANGQVKDTVSFVAASSNAVLYMSDKAIYATYTYQGDMISFLYNFFNEKAKDLMPSATLDKIKKLSSYDISDQAKITELSVILERWRNSLTDDESLLVENELANRMSDYQKAHKRELEKTGIVKITLNNFQVAAVGNISGRPLNQFALDEYNNYLRIATTVGANQWFFGIGSSSESSNDIYILNNVLRAAGSILDLGLDERIYSARFVADKGYLVTFKQVDPFFVLDLSDPENPKVAGELKIPGYSSYLHPISDDRILGIGKEDNQVKISLFDVSDPENPKEATKYTLNEYWSDILNTHHAFLLDKKHSIFFLPGSNGGYIFSYTNDQLELKKAVSGIAARRAVYINDYLYIISDSDIVVLNETNWSRVGELEL